MRDYLLGMIQNLRSGKLTYLLGMIQNLRSGKLTMTASSVFTTEATVPERPASQPKVVWQKLIT